MAIHSSILAWRILWTEGPGGLHSMWLQRAGHDWAPEHGAVLLGRKAMTSLDSALKNRDVTLPTKVLLVKAMVFPVVMCGCESWTTKKAEHRRIDAFRLWCRRRLLKAPWTSRRSNQSILKEINPEYSSEDWCWSWSSNTLGTWWEELTHWKKPCC